MRYLLASWGSRGDLHPFLALGQELIARGHEVTLVGNPDWALETQEAGLKFISSGECSLQGIIQHQHPEVLSLRYRGLVSLHALVKYGILPGLDGFYTALKKAAAEHDVLIAHHFVFAAPLVIQETGLPWVTAVLAPGVTPSAYTLPGTNFGPIRSGLRSRVENRMTWAVGRGLTRALVDPLINSWRKQRGLKPARDLFYLRSPQLCLHLFSEHFYPRPKDWNEVQQYGGFCFYDPAERELSPEVSAFLDAGDVPVLCTLGSTAVQNPGSFYTSISEALQELGLRGLLLLGKERNRPARLPDSILAVNYAPYGALMSKVKAVVHQGGIGTLAQALRAGRAALVCPYAFDQPNNARRVESLGLGIAVAPEQRSKEHLIQALKKLISGPAMVQAEVFGEKIRAEDGVALACAVLEKNFGRT